MQRHVFVLRALGTLAVTSMLLPANAPAQSARDLTAAVSLEARATAQTDVSKGLGRAADMLVQAAALRVPTDPIGVGDLAAAASGYYFSGKLARARAVSVQAGERALAIGDVDVAAHAFVFAAIIASQQRDEPGRDSLIARGNALAASPLLSQAQRLSILAQFRQPVLLAGPQK